MIRSKSYASLVVDDVSDLININVNGVLHMFEGNGCIRVQRVIDETKATCDVILVNGFTGEKETRLHEGDELVLIKKGTLPGEEELEALMCSRHTPNVHEVFKNAKVAIAGLGGLGSNIAVALARVGIGELILVDYDVVEPSNLNRQSYEISDIGQSKCHALVDQLKRINPYNSYKAVNQRIEKEDVADLFGEVDVIVEAFDDATYKAMLVNEVLTNMTQPIVSGSGMAGLYSPNTIQTKQMAKRLFICGDGVHEAKQFEGLMAPRVIVAAGHQATMVCQILLDQVSTERASTSDKNGGSLCIN